MMSLCEWRYRMREHSRRRILRRFKSGEPLNERQLRRMAVLTLSQWGILDQDELRLQKRAPGGIKAFSGRAW